MFCCKSMTAAVVALAALGGVAMFNAGAGSPAATATVGQSAPLFTLEDQTGNKISLADQTGKVVVLEWFNNECPFVQKHYTGGDMNKLAEAYKAKGVVWLAVNSTKNKTNADNAKIAKEWSIDRPILNDATGATGHTYGAKTTPHMYVIDKSGTLVYAGAIDSTASSDQADIAKSENYVAKALDEVLAGKPVTTAQTKSYGCGVKYAK
jgi:peroxiredoxin